MTPKALARMTRKCQGHEYAHLFAETAAAEANGDDRQLITCFLNGIVARVTDQIIQQVAGSTAWPDLISIRDFFSKVHHCLDSDIQRVAQKLADDPDWSPTVRSRKKDEAANPTQELLSVSLIGMTTK